MANNLTGDFDVAVEMTLPRLNRLLAAQHQAGVFPHSFTVRIDDRPIALHPPDSVIDIPTSGPDLPVEPPVPVPVPPVPPRPAVFRRPVLLGAQVPFDALPVGEEPATAAFLGSRALVRAANIVTKITRVQAWAEVQASTPTVTVPWGATSRVTLHFDVRAHVTIDPGSTFLPEFIHGDVALTVDAAQLGVQRGTQFVLDLDFLANNLEVAFTPAVGSGTAAKDVAAIENAIYSLMASGFVCGSAVANVPAEIHDMQLKTLQGARPAAALLLNLSSHASNPGSVNDVFVDDADDFAIAIGRDYIQSKVSALSAAAQELLDAATGGAFSPFALVTFYLSSPSVSVELDKDLFRVRVGVHVHASVPGNVPPPPGVPDDADVTVRQDFALSIDKQGVLQVASASDVGVDIEPGFVGDGKVKDLLRSLIDPYREMILNGVRSQLQPMLQQIPLNAILRDLQVPSPAAEFKGIEVKPEGVVLRGKINLAPWQRPVAASRSDGGNGSGIISLNAFDSWIPGGTVESYSWRNGVQQSDDHAFLKLLPYSGSGGPGRWCVTVEGSQTTDTGGRVHVKRASCIPYSVIFGALSNIGPDLDSLKRDRRAIVIPRPGPDPVPDAYVDPWAAGLVSPGARTNLLVHFADGEGPEVVRIVEQALAHGGLEDATVGLVLVLPRGQLARGLGATASRTGERPRRPNLIVSLSEDFEGGWARTFEMRRAPATYLVDALGGVRWRHAGPLHPEPLAAALREHGMRGGRPRFQPIPVGVAPGDRAPDFRFELAPGHLVPLRRLRRQPVTLVFWTSWAEPSLEELRQVERLHANADEKPLVLAVNDGEPAGRAREAFHRHRFRSQLVVDPEREIARAYGVHCWPTTIEVGAHGRIWHVQLGRTHDHEEGAVTAG